MKCHNNQLKSGHVTLGNQPLMFIIFFFSPSRSQNVDQGLISHALGDKNISLINIYVISAASVLPEEIH